MQSLAGEGTPRQGMDPDEVLETLQLQHSPIVRNQVIILDNKDVPTGEMIPVDMNVGGHVEWSYRVPDRVQGTGSNDAAAVRRTASLPLVHSAPWNQDEWITLVLQRRFKFRTELLSPQGNWIPFDLGVFVSTIPGAQDDGIQMSQTLELADKTYRYMRTLDETVVILAGTKWTDWLRADLRTRFGETKFDIDNVDQTFTDDLVFDAGITWLDAYNRGNAMMGLDNLITTEDGRPAAKLLSNITSKGPEWHYTPGGTMMTPGRVHSILPTLPNKVRFIARSGPTLPEEGNGYATRINQSTGPASIDARGGEIVDLHVDVEVEQNKQSVLEAIADADSQRYFSGGGLVYEGQVGINPLHSDRDVCGVVKPRFGLDDYNDPWIVTQWKYPFKNVNDEGSVLMDMTWERRVRY